MDKTTEAIVAIISAAFSVAIIAVLFSSRSQTAGVLTAGGGALSQIIGAAVSPVTGGSSGIGLAQVPTSNL